MSTTRPPSAIHDSEAQQTTDWATTGAAGLTGTLKVTETTPDATLTNHLHTSDTCDTMHHLMRRGTPFSRCIQIAGVHDADEARLLARCGVHAVGLPLRLPVNAEDIDEPSAARLVAALPPSITPVAITYMDDANEADAFCTMLGVRHLQLHGTIRVDELARLRGLRPDLYIIKSLVVRESDGADNSGVLMADVQAFAPHVDAFITDTFDPETGASGATGKTHDWAVSAALVRRSPRPVILAGGLHPGNVREAVLRIRPAGVDAHTGVEGPDGRKEENLVRRFVTEALAGFALAATP